MTRSSPLPPLLLAGALLLTGCDSSDAVAKVAQAPLEAPSPSPPPPPPVQPVVGGFEVITDDSSDNDQLGLADDGGPDEGAVEAATQAVAATLDRFLTSAQAGEPALEHVRGVWLRDVDPDAAAVLEAGLTSPENPVAAASYLLRFHLEPNPTLVAANVQVRRRDDTSVKVEMVFDVTGEQPTLHIVGGAEAL